MGHKGRRLPATLLLALAVCHAAIADGISGTGIAFRSIVIDGVHYDTTNALVRSNGEETTLDELKVGHRVYAEVDVETLSATEIDQYDAVSGRIDAVTVLDETLNEYRLMILGQSVRITMETVVHLDDEFEEKHVKEGKYVRVNGVRDSDGVIWATSLEKSEKKALVLSGIVDKVGPYAFEIGGLRIETPYHDNYVQEGWLTAGAAVLVLGGELEDGTYFAEQVITMPEELITLGEESFEPARTWLGGEVEAVDPEARVLRINGYDIDLDPTMAVLDQRDNVRRFDVDLLQPEDAIEVVVRQDGDRLRAIKLIRKKKAKPMLRASVEGWDDHETVLEVLHRSVPEIDGAELKYRGKKIDLEDFRASIGNGDGLLLEWDKHGRLKKLSVISDSKRWAQFWKKEDRPLEDGETGDAK